MARNVFYYCLIVLFAISSSSLIAQTAFTAGDALDVQSLSSQALSPDGQYVAGIQNFSALNRLNVDHFRFGDPTYIRPYEGHLVVYETENGVERKLSNAAEHVMRPTWSEDSKKLAYLKVLEEQVQLHIYDLESNSTSRIHLQSGDEIANGTSLIWDPDNEFIILEVRGKGWREEGKKMFEAATVGPVVEYDSDEPFLKWDAIRYYAQKTKVALVKISDSSTREILEEGIYSNLMIDDEGDFVTYVESLPEKTSYNRKDGVAYELHRKDLTEDSDPVMLLEKSFDRLNLRWSDDRDWFAWTSKGHVYVQSTFADSAVNITMGKEEMIDGEDTTKISFSALGWAPDNNRVLARSKEGFWMLDRNEESANLFYEFEGEEKDQPTLNLSDWSPDGRYIYLTFSAKDKWNRGMVRFDLQSEDMQELMVDGNLYRGWEMSDDGSKFKYSFSDGDQPDEVYVTDLNFESSRRITDLNPWITDKKLTRSELIKYLNVDGKEMNGILYYPVDYEEGKKYPLVCEIYERFFNNGYRSSANIIANKGYFMFRPSVDLEEGYPGESWLKGVTTGINKLIERGLVEEEKLGVHGTSYGGYAASLLITQTDRFAAAINISGKVNIISFLGDSPKIGTRNYAAAEVGQDRIGESLWEAPMKYFAHSAVLYADRIKTPHLLLTGEGDWNVPGTNTRELYYAMRRLGKKVVWVNYMNAGHGAGNAGTEDDYFDHWTRILDWYETYFEKSEKKANGRAKP